MSAHYSKFDLNTYKGTEYFIAHTPEDYPLELVLQKSRAFRRLPPHLRELAGLAKRWAKRKYPQYSAGTPDIEYWYDDEGYELNLATEARLTDEEIDAMWRDDPALEKFDVKDIPVPNGGFADPDTWEKPVKETEPEEEEELTESDLLRDIKSYGREYVAEDYSNLVPEEEAMSAGSDEELARMILTARSERHGKSAAGKSAPVAA